MRVSLAPYKAVICFYIFEMAIHINLLLHILYTVMRKTFSFGVKSLTTTGSGIAVVYIIVCSLITGHIHCSVYIHMK